MTGIRRRSIGLASLVLGAQTVSSIAQTIDVQVQAAMQRPAVQAAVLACMSDRDRLCPEVFPGGGRIVRCLAAQQAELSSACHAAMEHARDDLVAAGIATANAR